VEWIFYTWRIKKKKVMLAPHIRFWWVVWGRGYFEKK